MLNIVIWTLSNARSSERLFFGVVDTEVFGSTSIAFSEALENREFGAETRISGLNVSRAQ